MAMEDDQVISLSKFLLQEALAAHIPISASAGVTVT
jgi:hypothetical protein